MITVEDIQDHIELEPEYSQRGYSVYITLDKASLELADVLEASVEHHASSQFDNELWFTDEEKAQGREQLARAICNIYAAEWDGNYQKLLAMRLVGHRWPPERRRYYNDIYKQHTGEEMSYTHWRRIRDDEELALWAANVGANTAALELEIKKRKGEIDGFFEAKRLALKHVKEMVKKSHNLEQREASITIMMMLEDLDEAN